MSLSAARRNLRASDNLGAASNANTARMMAACRAMRVNRNFDIARIGGGRPAATPEVVLSSSCSKHRVFWLAAMALGARLVFVAVLTRPASRWREGGKYR